MSGPILVATLMRPVGTTGVQTHFQQFMHYLGQHGADCELLTPYSQPKWQVYPAFALRRAIDPVSKAASVWWYRTVHGLFVERTLQQRLAKGRAAIVYAQCPVSANAALRARRSKAQRVCMVVHFNVSQADEFAGLGMIEPGSAVYRSIRAFESRVLPQLDGIVYVSQFMRSTLQAAWPAVAAIRSAVYPNFVRDPGEGHNSPPERDLVAIGTLEPRKNQSYLLEVLVAAREIGKALSLTLVGDGPDMRILKAQVAQLGLQQQVLFTGYVPNGASTLAAHRACVHASRMENFPLVLIEAQAYGRPVFAPAVGGTPETFEPTLTGAHIPLDDAPKAARIIVENLDDHAWMENARQAARKRFLEGFATPIVADELRKFLESV